MFEPQTLFIPAAMLRAGVNQVQIDRRGPGRLIYGLSLKTYVAGEELHPCGEIRVRGAGPH